MSFDACAALVAKGDPDRFASAMTAPVAQRGYLLALYAFNLEVARAPWVSSEAGINEIRLQWWADAVDEIYCGAKPRAHEVMAPLAEVIRATDLPAAPFQALITARRHDIYAERFDDMDGLTAYLAATSGGLMGLAAHALGAPNNAVAAQFGLGVGAANLIGALPELIAAGRNPLPKGDDAQTLRALAAMGLSALAAARTNRYAVPKAARPALLAGWRANGPLRAAHNKPEPLLRETWSGSEFGRRSGLIMRTVTGRW